MTDRSPQLPDAVIERALAHRAPHGADAALMTEIVANARRTRQRRSWWPPQASARIGPRLTLAWVAMAVAGALTVGALLAGGLGHDRSDLSVVAPPGPSSTTSAQEPSEATSPSPTPEPSPDHSPSPRPVVTPAPVDLWSATTSRLPATAAGLAALLPTQLCGEPATIRTDLGLADPLPGEQTGQGRLRTSGFEGMLAAVGGPAASSLYAVASTADLTGPCPVFGVVRIVGADTYQMKTAFEHSVWRVDPGPCSTRLLQVGLHGEDIVQCHEGSTDGYYAFVDDAVLFVEATSDDAAASVLRDFSRRSAITYRSAFHLPFTIALERQWRVASEQPNEVNLTDADYPGLTVTIGLPYGFRDSAAVLRGFRTERYPAVTIGPLVSKNCSAMADPQEAHLAGLAGYGFECWGPDVKGSVVIPLYPRSSQGVAQGVPDNADHMGDWFVIPLSDDARVFVTDVKGTPVVITTHGYWANGPGRMGLTDADELLRTLKFDQ